MAAESSISLLLIGGAKAGKTHYGGQLLGRLNEKSGRLIMDGVATNIEPFEEVLRCLSEGRSAGHTPTTVYKESVWPVQIASTQTRASLVWPDYGGEQIRQILEARSVNEHWQQRIREADGWLLFIRSEQVHAYEDVILRPRMQERMVEETQQGADDGATAAPEGMPLPSWSDQAILVELLQLLLFVKQTGTLRRIGRPALTIILSCWDEIPGADDSEKPASLLAARLPLLSSFVQANWQPESLAIYGLSSLGKALKPDQPDDGYLDYGPEKQGWIIEQEGNHSGDLTAPIANLISLLEPA